MDYSLSLLEIPAVRDRVKPWSLEGYHLLGRAGLIAEDVELLESLIVEKMPESPRHEFFTALFAQMLAQVVPPGWLVRKEAPLSYENSEPEPDIALVRGSLSSFLDTHPTTAELVIEVAVPGASFDYQKRAIYAAAGVPEYWIMLPEERRIEVYTQPAGRDYVTRRESAPPQVLASESLHAFQVDLATFFPS